MPRMNRSERRLQAQRQPALGEDDARLIDACLDALWAEQGLARATLDGYRADLSGLARWMPAATRVSRRAASPYTTVSPAAPASRTRSGSRSSAT